MIEINSIRKLKINLADYDFHKDIRNRLLMSRFSSFDMLVLEEILYSSIKISIKKLAREIDAEEEKLILSLEKLKKMQLITFDEDLIYVDKNMRKYFEFEILKFEDDFFPDMKFFQSILKKVPIHVIPTWYSIPRSTNNIFESIIEKYLLTPQLYYRYLSEYNPSDPVLKNIIDEVSKAKDFQKPAAEIRKKYSLSDEQFEEYMLYLEYSCLCCITYVKKKDHWIEMITPYREWRDYLKFLEKTKTPPIKEQNDIERKFLNDFAFIENMSLCLLLAKKKPLLLIEKADDFSLSKETLQTFQKKCKSLKLNSDEIEKHIKSLIEKLCMLKLGDKVDDHFYALEGANQWLDLSIEDKALHIYRHPLNQLLSSRLSSDLCSERNIREAEKSIVRVLDSGWIYFDDFIHGVTVPISEKSHVMLKRHGNAWRYDIPKYDESEKHLIKKTIFNWLFEIGIIAKAIHKDKDCFCVTDFGRKLFAT